MRLTAIVLAVVAASIVFCQDPHSQSAPPEILGNFAQGAYSNSVLGIKLELPADWQIVDLRESEDFSRHLPRRMHLRFKSNQDWILLSSIPLDPDEKLQEVFDVSLMGAKDGGGFRSVGKPTKETRDGFEVLCQKLTRKLKSGPETGAYRGFISRGYFISVLHSGAPNTEEGREGIVKSLHILRDDSR